MNWVRRHKVASALLALIALVVIIVAASSAGSKTPTTPAVTIPTVSANAVASMAVPAPTPTQTEQTITFEVTGSNADVTYGPAGSNLTGTVPMHVTRKLGDPAYYSIEAQLQGGGNVTVKILINGKVVSKAEASGGYNIAMAEISQDPLTGGWQSDNG
jgi:hypothetical protein